MSIRYYVFFLDKEKSKYILLRLFETLSNEIQALTTLNIGKYEHLIGKSVTIQGRIWHLEFNSSNNFHILYILDSHSYFICQFGNDIIKNHTINIESFVSVTGVYKIAKYKTIHPDNLILEGKQIKVLSLSQEINEDIKRNISSIRFLYIRKPEIKYILLIKKKIRDYLTDFLDHLGYSIVETPIITSLPQVNRRAIKAVISKPTNLLAQNKYLIQKSQYYIEALAHAFHRVYTVTPAFRADHRESNLLLAEFWLLEIEELCSSMKEQMDLLEKCIKYVSSQLLLNDSELFENLIRFREIGNINGSDFIISELKNDFWVFVEENIVEIKNHLKMMNKKFPRLKYNDAMKILGIDKEELFQSTHLKEKKGEIVTKKYDSPIFIYEWPFSQRHFYDKKCPENKDYTHTFDFIGNRGYGEIASGGEREYRAGIVEKQIYEKTLRLESNYTLQWYNQFKKYGSMPHSGLSIGLERLTAWMTLSDHINKTIGFPRRVVGTDLQY